MRQALARPIADRIFFAGEATSVDHFGTTHGAYLSGLRVAAEIDQS
jgi:monoamine oxidase